AFSEPWHCRVSSTPRSKVFKVSSSGISPRSSRATSASSSASACSKSGVLVSGMNGRRYTDVAAAVNVIDAPAAGGLQSQPIVRPSLRQESGMNLKGSKTEKNLKDAFAGESQANRRYLYFAAKADVEGFNDVSAVFRSTAEGETGHAHGHLEYLEEVGDPATGKLI